MTDVYLRYNSGLRISENGHELAVLLDALVAAWPVPVQRLDLVGHSMGGLVVRSACHEGAQRGAAWLPQVRTVVTLGTPHHGAPLAQGAHAAQWLLRRMPETAPLARILASRSGGVRDLRHGTLVAEDWREEDDDVWLARRVTDVPFLPHATACFLGATITGDPTHRVGRLLGDGMVLPPSAMGGPTRGRSRHVTLDLGEVPTVGGVHHLALLNHPAVYRLLEQWLGEVPAAQPA
jgi:pimeloyl-ACP methyl ester carboxylesterase